MRAASLIVTCAVLALPSACKERPKEAPPPALGAEGSGQPAEAPISAEDRKTLLKLARRSLVASVSGLHPPALTEDLRISDRLKRYQGAFVTLKKAGQLRGCIGTLLPREPLYLAVINNARNAALHDGRFKPVSVGELDQVLVEISALSVPAPVAGPSDVVVGKHGVILIQGHRSATFLPHVATEQGWDRDTTLTHLARKAGLGPTAWRDPQTRLEVYTAEVWHE